jgi:hypothetical protein
MRVLPDELCEVISLTSEMMPSLLSSGVATLVDIVSGLAPDSEADTEITGKSTCGNGATGNTKKPPIPASATPMVSSTVPIGRLTKGAERFIAPSPHCFSPLLGEGAPKGRERALSRRWRATLSQERGKP